MKKFDGAILDLSGYGVFLEENFKDYRNVDELDYDLNGNNQLNANVAGKWYPRAPYNDDFGWGNERFKKSMVSLESNGSGGQFLRLTAKRIDKEDPNPPIQPRRIDFESGMIRSAPLTNLDYNYYDINPTTGALPPPEFRYGFTYGAFEIRARLPLLNAAGVWAAIWLFSGQIELDFLDNLKADPAQIIQSGAIHWGNDPEHTHDTIFPVPGIHWKDLGSADSYTNVETIADYASSKYYYKDDIVVYRKKVYQAKIFVRATAFGGPAPKKEGATLADGFNTYTVVWTPTEVCYFLNGYKIYSNTREYMQAKEGAPQLYINLQMAYWADLAVGESTYMDIESIRVYKPTGYIPTSPTYMQDTALYNFRFHDKTTIFNNLSSLNSTFPQGTILEKAVSDLIVRPNGNKVYFRSDKNRLDNFYFADPNPSDTDFTEKWNFDSLNASIINVMGDVVHHPTEERLFYRGKINNNNNKCSVFSFYYDPNPNNTNAAPGGWVNENLVILGNPVIDNVASDIVLSPGGKRVFYRNTNDSLCYFEKDAGVWKHKDTDSTVHNVADNVIHSPSTEKVYYRGTDNHLWNFYLLGGVWKAAPLNTPNYPYNAFSAIVAGDLVHSPILGEEIIYYRGIDSKIYFHYIYAGVWNHACLHTLAGITVPTGNVQGYIVHSVSSKKLFYIGYDNRLYNFYFENGHWKHACLNWDITNVAPSKYCVTKGKIFYKGTDDRLHLFYFNTGRWYARSLKDDGNNVAGNIALSSSDKPFYIGTDGGVWNYYETWSGNYDLTEEEISLD